MYRAIAFIAALTVFATLPANQAAAEVAELVIEEHYSEGGYEVDVYVTRGADGELLSEATIVDPARGEAVTEVDVWTDGTTVWWHGMIDGEPVRGSALARDFTGEDLGPLALLDCAHNSWCIRKDDTEVPGGAGGVPGDAGGGDGGDGDGDGEDSGGDGDGDGDGKGSGGGDED
jgi:hypothetical protein